MKWKRLKQQFRYYSQYFPFTYNTFAIGIAVWIMFAILKPAPTAKEETVSSFRPIVLLMGKIAIVFVLALIALSVLSCLICWLHFIWVQKKGKASLTAQFRSEEGKKGIGLEVILGKAHRPLLGFIKGRLFYDQNKMSEKFTLASNKRRKKKLWREAVTGKIRLLLPDIKEYTINGGFVYFEDMLQLCSLPVRQKMTGHFYRLPDKVFREQKSAEPKTTEDSDIRIDTLRKVQGEYLNYKDFESGDDVRRVVWKVYARSRDLVVRIPEIYDPYASHIYFYASFHAGWINDQVDGFAAEMLNFYKNKVWTAFETLSHQEVEIRYISDQYAGEIDTLSDKEAVRRVISRSAWHNNGSLDNYYKPSRGSVLCISSFSEPEEISMLLQSCSADTVVYYVKLSHTFRNFLPWTWLKRIFIQAPDDRLKRIRSRWLFSPMRIQILKREKIIESILKDSNVISGQL